MSNGGRVDTFREPDYIVDRDQFGIDAMSVSLIVCPIASEWLLIMRRKIMVVRRRFF